MGVAVSTLSSLVIQRLWQTVSSGSPELRRSPEKLAGAGGNTPKPRPWTRPSTPHTPPCLQRRGWVSKVLGWAFPSVFSPAVIGDEDYESLTGGDVNDGIGNHEVEQRIKNQVFTTEESTRVIESLRSRTTGLSNDNECAEIEERINQTIFFRDDSAHVIELLRSRTADLSDGVSGRDAGSTLSSADSRFGQNFRVKDNVVDHRKNLKNIETFRVKAPEVRSSPTDIAKAYMEGQKTALPNMERKSINTQFWMRRPPTEKSFRSFAKPSCLMPMRSSVLKDNYAQVNWIQHARQKFMSTTSGSAGSFYPSVMDSLHDFEGAALTYQKRQHSSSKGPFSSFSPIYQDGKTSRSRLGTVYRQSSRMTQKLVEHTDRSANPKEYRQDIMKTFSKPTPPKSAQVKPVAESLPKNMVMAASVGRGSSYVPAFRSTFLKFPTVSIDSRSKGPCMDMSVDHKNGLSVEREMVMVTREQDGQEKNSSSPSIRMSENMDSNTHFETTKIALDMSDDQKTGPSRGREMGTHECQGQEKSLPSITKSEDIGYPVHPATQIVTSELNVALLGGQEKGSDPQMSDDTRATAAPQEVFTWPSKSTNQNVESTQQTTNLAQKSLGQFEISSMAHPQTSGMAQEILEETYQFDTSEENLQHQKLDFSRPEPPLIVNNKAQQKETRISDDRKTCSFIDQEMDSHVSGLPDKKISTGCIFRDIDPTPQITIVTQEGSEHFDRSISTKKLSQVLELPFSIPKPCQKPPIKVSRLRGKDFPIRCESGYINPTFGTAKSAQEALEQNDQSLSPKEKSEVLDLTFSMPKPCRKPSIKVLPSKFHSVDVDPTPQTTIVTQEGSEHFDRSISTKKLSQVLELPFSIPKPCQKPPIKDFPIRCESGYINPTFGTAKSAQEALEQNDQSLSPKEKSEVLDLTFSMPKPCRKPSIKVFPSKFQSVDIDPTPQSTKIAQEPSSHFDRSISTKKLSQVLELPFSMLKPCRKPPIKVSRLPGKDFPIRCKSGYKDPTFGITKIAQEVSEKNDQSLSPKETSIKVFPTKFQSVDIDPTPDATSSAQKSLECFDPSDSPNKVSEVLDLSFSIWKPCRNPATFLMDGQGRRPDMRTSLNCRANCYEGNEFDTCDTEDSEEAYSESCTSDSESESEYAEHYGPPTKRRKHLTMASILGSESPP